MNKKIITALVLFIVISSRSFSQNDFRNGYIITLDNDTVYGQVDYRSNLKNYESCIFENGQDKIEYFPDLIVGFGYVNDKFFSSQIVKGSFVEVLVLGEISLYKSKNMFHLKKDTTVYNLEHTFEEIEIEGRMHLKENKSWIGITSYLIGDCIQNADIVVSTLQFDDKSLTKLIVRYNKCKGSDFNEFKTDKPWIKYNLGATVGLAKSEILTSNIKPDFTYLAERYSSMDPSFGILVDISSPRLAEKFSFQSEIHFIKSGYSSLVVLNSASTEYYDIFINLNTLSMPLSLKYSSREKKYGLTLQGGINLDYNLRSETKLMGEIVTGNTVYTLTEKPAFEIINQQIGYWGGVSILKSFQRFKINLAVRYFSMSSLSESNQFSARNNRFSINLILFKK